MSAGYHAIEKILSYHIIYADDTQIYITFHISNDADRKAALAKIEACIAEIRAWMVLSLSIWCH